MDSMFGIKAGIVWQTLHKNGPSNMGDLVKTTSMSREEIYAALGWLGRENKIAIERRGRAMVFSLVESESHSESIKSMTMEEPKPKRQPKRRGFKAPKKTKRMTSKAPKEKAQIESHGQI